MNGLDDSLLIRAVPVVDLRRASRRDHDSDVVAAARFAVAVGTDLRRIFQYIFNPTHFGGGLPKLVPHTVSPGAAFMIGEELTVTPLEVIHGELPVIAYRFNDFAYATDLKQIPTETMDGLRDLDVLVLDCVRIKPHSTHLCLEEAVAIIADLAPKRAFLTHLNHDILYERDSKLLPDNVQFGYDELVVEAN